MQSSNPYFVMPIDLRDSLGSLGQNIGTMVEKKRKQNIRNDALEKFKAGDFDGMVDIVLREPWLKNDIAAATGARDEALRSTLGGIGKGLVLGDTGPLFDHVENLTNQNKNAGPLIDIAFDSEKDPEKAKEYGKQFLALYDPDAYKKMMGSGGGLRKGATFKYRDEKTGKEYMVTSTLDPRTAEYTTKYAEIKPGMKEINRGQTSDERLVDSLVKEYYKGLTAKDKKAFDKIIDLLGLRGKFKIEQEEEPILQGKIEKERTLAKLKAVRTDDRMEMGFNAAKTVPQLKRAKHLLDMVNTAGWKKTLLRAQQFVGFESIDAKNMGELNYILAMNVLGQLKQLLGAQFAAIEGQWLERIEAGIGRDNATNKQIINQALNKAMMYAEIGIDNARDAEDEGYIRDINKILNLDVAKEFKPASTTGSEQVTLKDREGNTISDVPKKKYSKEQMKKLRDKALGNKPRYNMRIYDPNKDIK